MIPEFTRPKAVATGFVEFMPVCPRDKFSLDTHEVHGWGVRHCRTCAGLWLPSSVVASAVGRVCLPTSTSSTTLRCPDDGSSLVAVRHHGVEVDLCSVCGGIWLDHGELERILGKQHKKGRNIGYKIADGADGLFDAGEAIVAVLEFIVNALSGL